MNRWEKLNNREYIYKNLQLFYECSSEKVFKGVLENFTRNILNEILFNISIDDLKKLISARENWEYLKENCQREHQNFKINSNIIKQIYKDINEITDKNTKTFSNSDYCDVIEDIIY